MVIPRDENRAISSSKLIPPTPMTSIMSAGLLRVLVGGGGGGGGGGDYALFMRQKECLNPDYTHKSWRQGEVVRKETRERGK